MIASKKSGEKRPQIDESSDGRKSSKNTSKNRKKKEKHWEQRIWHKIEKEDFTMNILAKSGYKPLTRITNLGWQKAQTKSHTHLSPSLPKSTPK
jgi:hypothetical protein